MTGYLDHQLLHAKHLIAIVRLVGDVDKVLHLGRPNLLEFAANKCFSTLSL